MPEFDFLPVGVTVKAAPLDLRGLRFTNLIAVKCVGKHPSGSLLWLCRCDCGGERTCKSSSLRGGKAHSCGCHRARLTRRYVRPWNKGKVYAHKTDSCEYASKKAWTNAAKRLRGDKCSRCGWDRAPCDVHHIVTRSCGGKNTIENAEILCPNCHRERHNSQKGSI